MTKVYMRTRNDCVKACICSLLELDYDSLPPISSHLWMDDIRGILEPLGYWAFDCCLPDDAPRLRGMQMASIKSDYGHWHQHCVIVQDGVIVFDPQLTSTEGKPPCQPKILEYTVIYPLFPKIGAV